MVTVFPPIEPYETGLLDVGDGHSLYWECCGNPTGTPAVVLHGGPGSGCTPGLRQLFDPTLYRIVLFDQRGSGRSVPRVVADTDMSTNTTAHLVADIERLRGHLGVKRWVVFGVSWGVTLGLAYAERHRESALAFVASSVTLTRPKDIHWLYHETGRYYPEAWQRFRDGVPERERDGNLVVAYYRLLHQQPELSRRAQAAKDWCLWEDAASPLPGSTPNPRYKDAAFRMTFARTVTHYFRHGAWLAEDVLLDNAHRLAEIPAVLVHGAFDLGSPVDSAQELAQAWPGAELRVVDTGHTGGDSMATVVIEATNRFASVD